MDGGTGCMMAPDQLAQTLAGLAIPQDGISIESERLSADVPAFELCPAHAGAHPLDDEAALELRDGADDDDDGAA